MITSYISWLLNDSQIPKFMLYMLFACILLILGISASELVSMFKKKEVKNDE